MLAIRRSESFDGAIPHALHIEDDGNTLIVRDYYPRHRKHQCTDRGDSALLFDGVERTRTYRLVSTVEG